MINIRYKLLAGIFVLLLLFISQRILNDGRRIDQLDLFSVKSARAVVDGIDNDDDPNQTGEIICLHNLCLYEGEWQHHAQEETADPSLDWWYDFNNPTPPPVPTSPPCNPSSWSNWDPVCTAANCATAVQKRTNACGSTETKNCSCVIIYPSPSITPPVVTSSPSPTPIGYTPSPTPIGYSPTPSPFPTATPGPGTPTPTPITGGFISWFKTKNGDVHSNKDIMVSIPSLTEKFATFLVTVNALSSFAAGSSDDARPDLASEKNWYWYSPPYGNVVYPENSGFFSYYSHLKPAQTTLVVDQVSNSSLQSLSGNGLNVPIVQIDPPGGNVVLNEALQLTGNKQLVLYINGDLIVKNNIIFKDESGVIFIVKGNLMISENPSETDGMYLVDGDISTTDGNTNSQLLIHGSIYTSLTGKIFDKSRQVGNVMDPSEYVIFEPKYLVKFSQVLGRTSFVWREVAP